MLNKLYPTLSKNVANSVHSENIKLTFHANAYAMPPFYIDKLITLFLNRFANLSPYFDHFVYMLAENKLLKGGLVLAVFYLLWFQQKDYRKRLIITFMASFVAEVATIILSLTLPFRARPYTDTDIVFNEPVQVVHWWNNAISSFPSDHATMFTVLGVGVLLCDRKIGTYVISYILIFILAPRLYLGLHYFTDLVSGALIGMIMVWVSFQLRHVKKVAAFIEQFADQKPQYFYPLMFLITYQLVDLFTESREILGFIRHPFKY